MLIIQHFQNALHTEVVAYWMGDEHKTEGELETAAGDTVKPTRLGADDPRGTLKLKYVRPIVSRAKPLTTLDMCFSGEHEEAIAMSTRRRLSFVPLNGQNTAYFEVTITSMAKRNGGASIGYGLEHPYAMAGANWNSFGYSIDSGVIRNGVGTSPVGNVTNGLKKPKIGDIWGVGFQVHFAGEREDFQFLDDNFERRDATYPYRTSFFLTCNGVLKYLMYTCETPLMLQPVIMFANTNDGLAFNFVGDEEHPFKFNLEELKHLEIPGKLPKGVHSEVVVADGQLQAAPATNAPRLKPSKCDKPYIPIAKKTIQLPPKELATYGAHRFASYIGASLALSAADDECVNAVPFSTGADCIEVAILQYYASLSPVVSPDEAKNVYIFLNPTMTPQELNLIMNSAAAQQDLLVNTQELLVGRQMSMINQFEGYIQSFHKFDRFVDADGVPRQMMPSSTNEWMKQLFDPAYPFPFSMQAHHAMKAIRLSSDGPTHNLQGIYNNIFDSIVQTLKKDMPTLFSEVMTEIAWAETQMRRIVLKVPNVGINPVLKDLPPKLASYGHLTHSASYREMFDAITVLIGVGMIDLESSQKLEDPAPGNSFPNCKVVVGHSFPTKEEILAWAEARSSIWAELTMWNVFWSIPLIPDITCDYSKPILPEDVNGALVESMRMLQTQRSHFIRESKEAAAEWKKSGDKGKANRNINRMDRPGYRETDDDDEVEEQKGERKAKTLAETMIEGVTVHLKLAQFNKANKLYLEHHVECLQKLLRHADDFVIFLKNHPDLEPSSHLWPTISTYGMFALNSTPQQHRLRPLPLPSDAPVKMNFSLARHCYEFVSEQVQQLHFLVGPHPILAPLIEWRRATALESFAEANYMMMFERISTLRQLYASYPHKGEFQGAPEVFFHPISPNFNEIVSRDLAAGSEKTINERGRKLRPAAAVVFGVAFMASIAVVVSSAYGFWRKRYSQSTK